MERKIVCLYHLNCADGRAAAWVLRQAIPEAICYAMDYGDPLPEVVDGADVYLVDYSLKTVEAYAELSERARKVVVIDHHETAYPVLRAYAETLVVGGVVPTDHVRGSRRVFSNDSFSFLFDTEHSGAGLAWQWFFAEVPVPDFIRYVEDRDLFHLNYSQSRPLHAYLASKAFSFDEMTRLCDQAHLQAAIAVGVEILRPHDEQVARFVQEGRHPLQAFRTPNGYLSTPVFALPSKKWYTDVTNVAMKDPEIATHGIAIAWTITPENPDFVDYRITADPRRWHAGKMAQCYGGGGHPGAAGFKVPVKEHEPGQLATIRSYCPAGEDVRATN